MIRMFGLEFAPAFQPLNTGKTGRNHARAQVLARQNLAEQASILAA